MTTNDDARRLMVTLIVAAVEAQLNPMEECDL